MYLTPHFLAGELIGSKVNSLPLAYACAIASHFVLDAIPHRDRIEKEYLRVGNLIVRSLDVAVTVAATYFIFGFHAYIVGVGLAAIVPDLFEILYKFQPSMAKVRLFETFHNWHVEKLQFSRVQVNWFWGLAPQLILMTVIWHFAR
jgi:hypothetical protein